MKKILLLLSLIGPASFSFAQSAKIGLTAGVNFSSVSISVSGIKLTSSDVTGFHVGAVADFGLGSWSIQPGLLYTTKGGSFGDASTGGASKLTLNYLEVPVNVLYHIPAGVGNVFLGGGPYLGYGLSGKSTQGSASQDVTFGSGSNDTKNPDFGINLLGGFRFKTGLSLSAGYGIGLSNLANGNNGSAKNMVTSFSVGYFFH